MIDDIRAIKIGDAVKLANQSIYIVEYVEEYIRSNVIPKYSFVLSLNNPVTYITQSFVYNFNGKNEIDSLEIMEVIIND